MCNWILQPLDFSVSCGEWWVNRWRSHWSWVEAAAVMGLVLRDEPLIELCAIPLPCLFLLMSFRFSSQWKNRKIWLASFHRELMRLCTHQCCRSGTCHRNLGQGVLASSIPVCLTLRNAVAEGGQDARLWQCLPTGQHEA